MDAKQKIEAVDIRKLVENLILADRVMQSKGFVTGDRYEELCKPIRKARIALDDALEASAQTLASKDDEIARLRARLSDEKTAFYDGYGAAHDDINSLRAPAIQIAWDRRITPQPTE